MAESSNIENATFPGKLPNVKISRMGNTKWTYHKERGFAVTLFFKKRCFSLRTSIKSWFNVPTPQISIFIYFASAGVLIEGAFSLWLSSSHISQSPLRYNFSVKLKACVRYFFLKKIIYHQMIAFQKLWKMVFISSKKLFSFSRYLNFCNSIFPSFSPS